MVGGETLGILARLDHNLEFAYRLVRQPFRITRQIHLVRFMFLVWVGRI